MGKLIVSQGYIGDMAEDQTFYFWFSSCDKNGASVALTALGTLGVTIGSNGLSVQSGMTVTQTADGIVGLHRVEVDLSVDTSFVGITDYTIGLTGAVVDGETINAVLCHFSIKNRLK